MCKKNDKISNAIGWSRRISIRPTGAVIKNHYCPVLHISLAYENRN